ncbi:hypothetical protein EGT50_10050 [Rhodococcus xishaensis]|uniref:Uncharacterized protein n=1 Tax=Rhodococcus xishaensis TaxID=2487364 RepID=A0A3S3A697_9NOCA|nr:hypothetical protein EGT50_10050 [Rhodococcus xishaensis]
MAAPLLSVAFAAPANAAPEDVTLSVDVRGNFVEVAISNNSRDLISCDWQVVTDDGRTPGSTITGYILPDEEYRIQRYLNEGNYVTSWGCMSWDSPEVWGTEEFLHDDKTAEPIRFTTPVGPFGSIDLEAVLGNLDSVSIDLEGEGFLGTFGSGSLEGVLGFS